MKHIYKCLMVIVILVSVLIFVCASIKDVSSQSVTQLAENVILRSNYEMLTTKEKQLQITDIISTNSKFPLSNIYKVGVEKANLFSLSYVENELKTDSIIELDENGKGISDQVYYILENSYPNISLKEMGLDTEEEAYQAEQLAIWEVAYRLKESKFGSELSRIESIKADMGNRNVNTKVFEKAEQLRDFAMQYSTSAQKQYEVQDNDSKLDINIGQDKIFNLEVNGTLNYAVGPITYTTDAGNIADTQVVITDSFGNIMNGNLVSAEGTEIENISPDTEFYIAFSDYPGEAVNITVNVNRKIFMPSVYEYKDVDYIANTCSNQVISNSVTVGF